MAHRLLALAALGLVFTAPQVSAANVRAMWVDQLRQVGLAQDGHHDVYNHFADDLIGADGQPSLSWRVRLLPFLELDHLYPRFKPAERWNSPTNKALVSEGQYRFASPVGENGSLANVVRPLGPGTFWGAGHQRRRADLKGDPARTILLVEVDNDHAPVWTEPRDLTFDPDNPRKGLHFRWQHSLFDRGCFVVMADTRVALVSERINDDSLRALFAGEGAGSLSYNWFEAMLWLPQGQIIGPGLAIGVVSIAGGLVVVWRLRKGRAVAPGEYFWLVLGAEYLVLVSCFIAIYEYRFLSDWQLRADAMPLIAGPRLVGALAACVSAFRMSQRPAWATLFGLLAALLAITAIDGGGQYWRTTNEASLFIAPAPFVVGFSGLFALFFLSLPWLRRAESEKRSRLAHVLGLAWSVVPLAWFCVWSEAGYIESAAWFVRIRD